MKAIVALNLFLFPIFSFASATLPTDLMYEGKPIDPLCIYEANANNGIASLNECGISAEKQRRITGQNSELINSGYVGFDYDWSVSQFSEPSHGTSYYKSFGKANGAHIIYALNNSGGSGQFSGVYLVKRKGDTLEVQNFMGGDRCNGGIYNVKKQNERLTYNVNLTAYDFLTLANDNPHNIGAYDDLYSCATCCQAAGVYERQIGNNFQKEKLLYVDLNAYETAIENNASDQGYQMCFDNLIDEYKKKGKSHLSGNDLKTFTHEFNSKCIKA